MSGTAYGVINHLFNSGDYENNSNEAWVALYNAMEHFVTSGLCTRHASYFGDAGTGMSFWDAGSPPGKNAFAVYKFAAVGARTWDFYVLIQWSTSTPAATGKGAPFKLRGGSGSSGTNIGVAVATAFTSLGANADPWTEAGGTTNADGTDAKGNYPTGPVWAAPASGTVHVWPRSNALGGSHVTNKENTSGVVLIANSAGLGPQRLHIMADNDSLGIAYDQTNGGVYNVFFVTPYTPVEDATPDCPMVMIGDTGDLAYTTLYGPTSGATTEEGGVYNIGAEEVTSVLMDIRTLNHSATHQPNNQFSPSRYTEERIAVYGAEAPKYGAIGLADPFVRQLYNCATNSTLDTMARAVFGGGSTATNKISLPWDGVTADPSDPASTRTGVTF